MSDGFIHSVKVPRIYKVTANIVRCVQEQGASLKSLIYEKKHPNVSGIYALSVNTLKVGPQLDLLLERTQILTEQPRLDPWLTRVLITELLWGKKHLHGPSKPIQTISSYADLLRKELENLDSTRSSVTPRKVQRPRYVRINTLLLSIEEAISLFEEEGWKLISKSESYSSYLRSLTLLSEPYFLQDFHVPEVLAFPSSASFHDHAGYKNGKLILQDKASCLPAHLLDPKEGSHVLDLCAAPGMKSTHLAAKLQNKGTIYAVEIDKRRFETLREQIEITHSFCVKPYNQDALTFNPKHCHRIRYVLVDPSCSGSGIVDRPKRSDVDGEVEPERLQNLQSIQVYLLRYALLNFPNVKKVVYSTCSVHPEENEKVIDEVLGNVGDAYRLVSIKDMLKENWLHFSSPEYQCGDKCLYSKPDIDLCNGFFVAMFERNFEVPLPECKRKGGNANLDQSNLDTEKDNITKNDGEITEKVSRKKKKRGKKKKGTSSMIDEQADKTSEQVSEFEKNVETEDGKVDKPEDGEVLDNEKVTLNESEDVPQNAKSKKKKKKKLNDNEDASQVEDNKKNKETIETCGVEEMEQDEEIRTTSPKKKKKKKKKKEDEEVVEIDDDIERSKEDEQTEIEPVKKKRKTKKKNEEIIEIDNDEEKE